MPFKPLKFTDSESCLKLTKVALKLNQRDAEFLDTAMRAYAEMRHHDWLLELAEQKYQAMVADV